MDRSRISDQGSKCPALPEAPAQHQEIQPAADLGILQLHGRDLSNRPQILIRSSTPLPPWYGDFFQRVLEYPVSTEQGPQHPQVKSQPSASNGRSSFQPSDLGGQPGASGHLLGEEVRGAYKMELRESEKEFKQYITVFSSDHLAAVSSPHSTSGVAAAEVSTEKEEFDETEEFEENDEFSAEWISRERWRQSEIRRDDLLKIEAREECSRCSVRSVEVRFRPVTKFFHGVLWPCEPQEDPEYESEEEFD